MSLIMEAAILQKFDQSVFAWRELPSKDGFARMLGGAEAVYDVWTRFHKGAQTIVLGAQIDVKVSLSETQLVAAARDTWIWLRFYYPTIAATIDPEDDGTSRLVYKLGSERSVADWADRTFIVQRQKVLNVVRSRNQIAQKQVPSQDGDLTFSYLVFGPSRADGLVSTFNFLFHTHHATFDGNGVKIILSKYLRCLAQSLGTSASSSSSLQWGTEGAYLTPAAFNILLPSIPQPIPPESTEEPTFAHPYYGAVASLFQAFAGFEKTSHSFKPRDAAIGMPTHAREEDSFSIDESTRLIAAMKSNKTGQSYTISHLAHAALAMVVIAHNPPTPEAKLRSINSHHLMNCRSSLIAPYSSHEGFTGCCLGISDISVPVSLFLAPDDTLVIPFTKDVLVKVMKVIREQYVAKQHLPDPINFMGLVGHIFAKATISQLKANSYPPHNGFIFSSDGISEKWLDSEFSYPSGRVVLTLPKFILSVNQTDPAPCFRITTWKGVIQLSADYNANIVTAGEIKVCLGVWKKFMLLGLDLEAAKMPQLSSLYLLALIPVALAQQSVWGQCGGIGWTGPTTCVSGATCTYSNDWYSQCLPGGPSVPPPAPSTTVTSTSSGPLPTGAANFWFSFGDSYTQTGFSSTGTVPVPGNPLGNPAYPGNTATGGANWIDLQTTTFNKSLVLTYNYAYGGATIDAKLVPPFTPSILSMTDQVNLFLNSVAKKPASAPWTSSNAIFSFWIGINDIGTTYNQGGDRSAFSDTLLNAYFALVQKLMMSQGASAQATEKAVITGYNTKLASKVASFQSGHADVQTWIWDSNTMFTSILNSPRTYGFNDATSVGNGAGIFWGDVYHPTSAAHRIFAQQVANLLVDTVW
ncbi:hypothetical protein ONZ45_g7377 [Pleurotus djamor]|nr:hypothetical protein ONZ45_g7377 [Pleurotus djamor]